MPWRDGWAPDPMTRVAVAAPESRWPKVLAAVAEAAVMEPEGAEQSVTGVTPDAVTAASTQHNGVRAVAGWVPASAVADLDRRLAPLGGGVVALPDPPGIDPPTRLAPTSARSPARPLVDTYATVPYRNLDPTLFAATAYVVMFGMMFGDVGDGLLVVVAALWLRRSNNSRLAGVRRVWPLVLAMGVAAAAFGFLYGEFFGPTGVVPALWLEPLDEPTRLLTAGIVVGAGLLAVAYAIGVVNRWREGGPSLALYSPSGFAGAGLFVALALIAGGMLWTRTWMWVAGAVAGVVALALVAVGLKVRAGAGAAGGMQATVETVDVVIRLGSNVVSFARLAAFGLMHAALAKVVWDATTALSGNGLWAIAAVVVFVIGSAIAFGLEALVACVQALRLEYYELFSRVFATEGRPFRPLVAPSPPREEST